MTLGLLFIFALVCWISLWTLSSKTHNQPSPLDNTIVIENPADRWIDTRERTDNSWYDPSCIGSRRGGQIGTMTGNVNGMTTVLPLLGHESRTRRSRWHYYTYTDSINKQPIPVLIDGKDCMANIGCPEILDGSMDVKVAPYNTSFETYLFN